MAASMEFVTAKRRVDPITFKIDGEEYVFTPPKTAPAMFDMFDGTPEAKATFDWLGDGLAEGQTDRLIARLRNKEDDFDIVNLEPIVKWLMGKVSGRPTT